MLFKYVEKWHAEAPLGSFFSYYNDGECHHVSRQGTYLGVGERVIVVDKDDGTATVTYPWKAKAAA